MPPINPLSAREREMATKDTFDSFDDRIKRLEGGGGSSGGGGSGVNTDYVSIYEAAKE